MPGLRSTNYRSQRERCLHHLLGHTEPEAMSHETCRCVVGPHAAGLAIHVFVGWSCACEGRAETTEAGGLLLSLSWHSVVATVRMWGLGSGCGYC
jgi:hypothetical protein